MGIDDFDVPIKISAPILDNICMPPFAGYHHDDFSPMIKLARLSDPKIIVELGTAHGNTTANLARNCPAATIYTVNAKPENMSGVLTSFSLTKQDIGCVYKNSHLSGQVHQILENTLDLNLEPILSGANVDFGIVDACHDAEYVVNDFAKIVQFTSDKAIIILHDTHPSMKDHTHGSYTGCMYLRREGYDVRYLRNTFWGIWCKNWNSYLNRS